MPSPPNFTMSRFRLFFGTRSTKPLSHDIPPISARAADGIWADLRGGYRCRPNGPKRVIHLISARLHNRCPSGRFDRVHQCRHRKNASVMARSTSIALLPTTTTLLRHIAGFGSGEAKPVMPWRAGEQWHCAFDPYPAQCSTRGRGITACTAAAPPEANRGISSPAHGKGGRKGP